MVGVAFNSVLNGVDSIKAAEKLFGRLAELNMLAQIQVQGDQLVELLGLIDRTSVRLLVDHYARS